MSKLQDKLQTTRTAREAGLETSDNNVLAWLNADSTQREIVKALPRGMDAGRFARIVQTEVRKNPALLESTPHSFILAVLNAAQLGLEPGPLGHSYLTGPFRNGRTGKKETVLILGYKGLKELAYRTGLVDLVDAVAVHEGEPFRIVRGSEQRLEHEELPSCADNPIVAYYAIAFARGSQRAVFEVMWPKDIDAIRKRSRAKDDGPWMTDPEAMSLKTVTRRLLNRGKVRLTPDVQHAIAEDEARELGFDRPEVLDPALLTAPASGEGEGAQDTASHEDLERGKDPVADSGDSVDAPPPDNAPSSSPGSEAGTLPGFDGGRG